MEAETETTEQRPSPSPSSGASFDSRPPSPGGYRGRPAAPSAEGDDKPRMRRGGRRRRVCLMCAEHMKTVDYKNVSLLRRFVSDRARIETRRRTSACAKHQRAIARAVKRARHLALLPYTAEHIRTSQGR